MYTKVLFLGGHFFSRADGAGRSARAMGSFDDFVDDDDDVAPQPIPTPLAPPKEAFAVLATGYHGEYTHLLNKIGIWFFFPFLFCFLTQQFAPSSPTELADLVTYCQGELGRGGGGHDNSCALAMIA